MVRQVKMSSESAKPVEARLLASPSLPTPARLLNAEHEPMAEGAGAFPRHETSSGRAKHVGRVTATGQTGVDADVHIRGDRAVD